MQRRRAVLVLAVLIAASTIMTAMASTSTTLTWEKTFEVKNPEITAKILIGNPKIVGYPLTIWVSLRVQVPFEGDHHECKDNSLEDCNMSLYSVNGTYAANLFWLNATDNQWQLLQVLQNDTNVTLTCRWYTNTYVFTPMQIGQYKVVVTFTTDTATQTFTSED